MTPLQAVAVAISGAPFPSKASERKALAALQALADNISEGMVRAAMQGRDETLPAAVVRDVFTAMIRAAMEEG